MLGGMAVIVESKMPLWYSFSHDERLRLLRPMTMTLGIKWQEATITGRCTPVAEYRKVLLDLHEMIWHDQITEVSMSLISLLLAAITSMFSFGVTGAVDCQCVGDTCTCDGYVSSVIVAK